jgi:hypothetical protein
MTISIRLDAPSVRALVKDDEEFALELSRAVVADIVHKLPGVLHRRIEASMEKEITRQLASATKPSAAGSYGHSRVLADDVRTMVTDAARSYVSAAIDEGQRQAEAVADTKIALWQASIDATVRQRVDHALNDEVDRRVVKRLNEVLQAIATSTESAP